MHLHRVPNLFHLNKANHLTCTATGEAICTKYNITCKSSNLIHCITCKTCLKQYVEQTKNSISQRFCSHFFTIRHKKLTDAVGLHFSRADHQGMKDVSISVLEFTQNTQANSRNVSFTDLDAQCQKASTILTKFQLCPVPLNQFGPPFLILDLYFCIIQALEVPYPQHTGGLPNLRSS